MARTNERGVTPQSEDFSAWYNELVVKAELADRGPVKGTTVIRPYGYRIWELMVADLDERIRASGVENAYFPLLIPESHLRREAEHVEGFAPELAVVTHAGGKDLDEPLVIRPTSETVIGEYFAKWITSYRDLPLRINQWANVVRWELRPRLFLRTTEFLWQEGHTAHASAEEAGVQVADALEMYRRHLVDVQAIPVVAGEKTPHERFAGADRTFTVEAMMRDTRALQAGTSHDLGQNFARAFEMEFTDESGARQLCYTTSWGVSTRLVGGVVMAHGDDKGLVLPPRIAPIQVVIVPIGRDEEIDAVLESAARLSERLGAAGVRVKLDRRTHLSAGYKFNEWELRGVPYRVELGPRDLASGTAVLASRLGGAKDKVSVSLDVLVAEMPERLESFHRLMLGRAEVYREENTRRADRYPELVEAVGAGFAMALSCGDASCDLRLQQETAATPRCIPLDGEPEQGPCAICGRPSVYGTRVLYARAY